MCLTNIKLCHLKKGNHDMVAVQYNGIIFYSRLHVGKIFNVGSYNIPSVDNETSHNINLALLQNKLVDTYDNWEGWLSETQFHASLFTFELDSDRRIVALELEGMAICKIHRIEDVKKPEVNIMSNIKLYRIYKEGSFVVVVHYNNESFYSRLHFSRMFNLDTCDTPIVGNETNRDIDAALWENKLTAYPGEWEGWMTAEQFMLLSDQKFKAEKRRFALELNNMIVGYLNNVTPANEAIKEVESKQKPDKLDLILAELREIKALLTNR